MQQPREATSEKESPEKFIVMMCMFTAGFMQQLDGAIINVALPHMQGNLQASPEQITWVLTSYLLATAVMTAPAGWLSNRLGRKIVFQVSVAGFTLASVLCGMAQSLDQIILFRFLQGAAGGALLPIALAVTFDSYDGRARFRMLAIFAAFSSFGPIIGPAFGGYITDALSWRWTFYINAPMGLLILALVGVFFRDEKPKLRLPFDAFGFVTLAFAIAAWQLMLDRGPTKDWFGSTEIILEASVVAVAGYLFAVHMATHPKPFIPPQLFRNGNFIIGTSMATINIGLMFASSAVLPTFLQALGGRSVLETGIILSPRGVGAIVGAVVGARMVAHLDMRAVVALIWLLSGWSLWTMAHWTPDIGVASIIIVSFIQGVSQTGLAAVNNLVSFSTLPGPLNNDGTAVSMLVRNLGSAVLISLSATLLSTSGRQMYAELGTWVSPFNRILSSGAQGLFLNPLMPPGRMHLDALVTHNAAVIAYSNLFLFMFYLSCFIPLLGLMIKVTPKAAAPTPMPLTEH